MKHKTVISLLTIIAIATLAGIILWNQSPKEKKEPTKPEAKAFPIEATNEKAEAQQIEQPKPYTKEQAWEEFKLAEAKDHEKLKKMLENTQLYIPNKYHKNKNKTNKEALVEELVEELKALQGKRAEIYYENETWNKAGNTLKATRIIKFRWEQKTQKITVTLQPSPALQPPLQISRMEIKETTPNPKESEEIANPSKTKFDGKNYVLTQEIPKNLGWKLIYQTEIPDGENSKIFREKIAFQTKEGVKGPSPKEKIGSEEEISKLSEKSIEFFTNENPKPYECSYWKLTKTKSAATPDTLEIVRMREDPEGGTLSFTFTIQGDHTTLKNRFPKEKSLSDWNMVPWPGEDLVTTPITPIPKR